MNTTRSYRRRFLKGIVGMLIIAATPFQAFARAVGAFTANDSDTVLKELFGDLPIVESDAITFKIPEIAENGAVVPVTISTDIEGVEQISLVIDQNPTPLSAVFDLGKSSLPDVSTRVKIGKSSTARALVRTSNRVYMATKEVKVTIGGCGG